MTLDEFWNTIDRVKSLNEDQGARADLLAGELSRQSPERIQEFYRLYQEQVDAAYSWELWGAAYVMMGGCSDDSFDYFRDWLISEGKDTYDKAVADPDSLAELGRLGDFPELEEFRYVALAVYEEKAGKMMESPPYGGSHDPTGVSWDEDVVHLGYPKLSGIYFEDPLE